MRFIKLGKVKIDILILFVLLISYVCGIIEQLIMAYLAVFIHEAAHAFVAILYGCKIKNIYFLSFGTKIEIEISIESRMHKTFIYAAGPLINYFTAILIFLLVDYNDGLMKIFVISNLYLASFNLLPLNPLDGGEILSIYTTSKYGLFYSQKISRITYIVIITVLIGISIPVAVIWGNFSILIIAIFILSKDKKNGDAAFVNAKNIYYRKTKLLKKGYYGVRELVVLDRLTLGMAFKLLDFDQYHILIILDDSMKITNRCTESELLTAINDYGYGCTFKEYLKDKKVL